jgi:hypothetical protein
MLVYGLQGRPPLRSAFRIFESEAIEVLDGWGWVKPRRGFTVLLVDVFLCARRRSKRSLPTIPLLN